MNKMDFKVEKFKELLEELLDEELEFTIDESDIDQIRFYFENDYLDLLVSVENDTFKILEITSKIQGEKMGTKIYTEIENFCISQGYHQIVADKVYDSAIEFWEKQGFERDNENYVKYL